MASGFKLIGMDDVQEDLERLKLTDQRRILGTALKPGSQILVEELEHRAPRDSGRLANSMRFSLTERSATSAVSKIGPTAWWGGFNEFGTRFMARQPFFTQAWDAKIDEAWAVVKFHLGELIAKALRKLHG